MQGQLNPAKKKKKREQFEGVADVYALQPILSSMRHEHSKVIPLCYSYDRKSFDTYSPLE